MRVHFAGGEGPLARAAAVELRAGGHAVAASPDRADAVAFLCDAEEGPLAGASEALVGATAAALDALPGSVKRLLVVTPADIYGEGPGECSACGRVRPDNRARNAGPPWDPRCPRCEGPLSPAPVREDERVQPATPLAALRLAREDLVLTFARARGLEAAALRVFELFGPGLRSGAFDDARAAARAGRPAEPPEDGLQTRDFLHERDAARAVVLALAHPRAPGEIFNAGTGRATRLADLAASLARGGPAPLPTGVRRAGEPRHLVAEAMKLRNALGWRPEVTLGRGIEEALGVSAELAR